MNLQRPGLEAYVFRFIERCLALGVVVYLARSCGAGCSDLAHDAIDSAERSIKRLCMTAIQCSNKLRVSVIAFPREPAPETDFTQYEETP